MFGLFITTEKRTANLKGRITELENDRDHIIDENARLKTSLSEQLSDAKDKLSDLKREHKHSEEDVAHLLKIRESQLEITFEKKTVELQATQATAIATVKDEYRDKVEKQLNAETQRITDMYSEVLERLPNVNLAIKQSS